MKTLLTIGLTLLSFVTVACDCNGEERSVDSIYLSEGGYIFTGKVVAAKLSSTFYKQHKDKKFYYQEVTLEITESFKGDSIGQVTIINESWSSCGTRFEMGEEYLIYPIQHPDFGKFMVHQCYKRVGTKEYKKNDIERLRELIKKNGG